MIMYMTLVHLNISPSMDFSLKLVRIPSSSRIFTNKMLVTMYLHRNTKMRTLKKALSDKSSVASIKWYDKWNYLIVFGTTWHCGQEILATYLYPDHAVPKVELLYKYSKEKHLISVNTWNLDSMTGLLIGLIIGRWIGVSHMVRQLMYYWMITVFGWPISCMIISYQG